MTEFPSKHSGEEIDKAVGLAQSLQPLVTKDINFRDYDGTLLRSYTIAEAAALTELPSGPTHSRLIFQEWNWTLADTQATGRAVDIGATHTTASGKSEFDLTLTVVTGLSVTLRIYNVTAGNTITVDWGDGATENATTTTVGEKIFTHNYPTIGQYTAAVDGTGAYYPYGTSTTPYNMFNVTPSYICTAVRLGARCTSIGAYAFQDSYSLKSITIPNSVTSIRIQAFYGCSGLTSVTIPNSVTTIENYVFRNCYNRTSATIPNSVTTITLNMFQNNYSQISITIPSSVTSIGNYAFQNCFGTIKYTMLSSTPPTLVNITAFSGINGICIIEVPVGSLTAYQTATNWTQYAEYMREVI